MRNPQNGINRPRAICPNGTVGAVPVCPPERPRSGVSIPKTHALCVGMNGGCALVGRRGRAHRRRPYQPPPNRTVCHYRITLYIRQFTPIARCVHTPPYCTFDSSKSHGVPIPHRGYTFDSAGLASVTQPTLGNGAREDATPLGVVLFLIAHHHHTVPNE